MTPAPSHDVQRARLTTGPTHVRLEIHADADEFRGRAISDVESREFHGWIGLVGTLEAMIENVAAARGGEA